MLLIFNRIFFLTSFPLAPRLPCWTILGKEIRNKFFYNATKNYLTHSYFLGELFVVWEKNTFSSGCGKRCCFCLLLESYRSISYKSVALVRE